MHRELQVSALSEKQRRTLHQQIHETRLAKWRSGAPTMRAYSAVQTAGCAERCPAVHVEPPA